MGAVSTRAFAAMLLCGLVFLIADLPAQAAGEKPQPNGNDGSNGISQLPPDEIQLAPIVIDVGKWAEGIAFDGRYLWVSESGQRTIGKIDPQANAVVDRVRVGRLPVAMVSDGDGVSFSLVHTDQLVWRQPAGGGGGVLARLDTCPQSMTMSAGMLWAIVMPECSTVNSRLVSIDPQSGAQRQSAILGEWGEALAGFGSDIWIAHARTPALTIVDQATLTATAYDVYAASFWSITSNSTNVFAGGRVGTANDHGLVVQFDPRSRQEFFRWELPQRIAEIAADERHVIAVGGEGMIFILAAQDLTLKRTITLSSGPFSPRGIVLLSDTLLLSSSTHSGENGAVFVVEGWRP